MSAAPTRVKKVPTYLQQTLDRYEKFLFDYAFKGGVTPEECEELELEYPLRRAAFERSMLKAINRGR